MRNLPSFPSLACIGAEGRQCLILFAEEGRAPERAVLDEVSKVSLQVHHAQEKGGCLLGDHSQINIAKDVM